jgi:transcriptional regulator with XRE-family HTH domain
MSDPATSPEQPAVARRRLRLALRGFRERRHMTQQHVADALEWSLSKIIRIEGGEVTISRSDLGVLLAHYGVRDDKVVQPLLADARAARRKGWWTEPHFREQLTAATQQLVQFESVATTIRCFQPTVVPGPLQTPRYAEAIFNYWSGQLDESTRIARVDSRARRFAQIFQRPHPAKYQLILDESVILREIGGPEVASEQLTFLLDQLAEGRVQIRVLPLTDPAAGALIGPFTVIDLDDESALIYREAWLGDEIVQTFDEVGRHRGHFDRMWEDSFGESVSRDLLVARSSAVIASLGRSR